MVQPHPAALSRAGVEGRVTAQRDELGDLGVGQPDLDVLDPVGEVGEPDGAHGSGHGARVPGGGVQGQDVTAGQDAPRGQPAVHDEVVDTLGEREIGHPGVAGRRPVRVEFQGGGAGAERQPDAGGPGLGQPQVLVGDLGAGPGREAVGQQAVLAVFQVEGAAHQARRHRCGDGGRGCVVVPGRDRFVLGVHPLTLAKPAAGRHPVSRASPDRTAPPSPDRGGGRRCVPVVRGGTARPDRPGPPAHSPDPRARQG